MKDLDDLLETWEAGIENGENPTAEELCVDCPELLDDLRRQISALQLFASTFGVHGDAEPDVADDGQQPLPLPVRAVRVVTQYQLERLHAVGGLGSVYVARDSKLDRRIALKFPRGRKHTAATQARFEREARITGRLDHPGIVPVHTIHQDADGYSCYAMRFVQGHTFQEAIDRFHQQSPQQKFRSPEFRELLQRFRSVCEIVAYAHSQGVIHRDIKPSNIMLGAFGETLLVDWGLAKVLHQPDDIVAIEADSFPADMTLSAELTRHNQMIGTPAFASPEQLLLQGDRVNQASDVFSLGATLFYLLTGEHLLQNIDLPRHLRNIQENRLPRPKSVCSGVPAPLDLICHQALSVNPAARYASPQELSRDLERFLADEPISISGESWRIRAARWLRKHPVLTASTLAAVFVGFAVAAVSSVYLSDKNKQLSTAIANLDKTNQDLNVSNDALSNGIMEREIHRRRSESALATGAQTLKSLHALSGPGVATFPDPADVYVEADRPFLEKLLERYLGLIQMNGLTHEGRYIRAMGRLHSGGLYLALDKPVDAEQQLQGAKQDLLILQMLSDVTDIDHCVGQCCALLGECHRLQGVADQSRADFQEALVRFEKLLQRVPADHSQEIQVHRAAAVCALSHFTAGSAEAPRLAEQLAVLTPQLEELYARGYERFGTGLAVVRVLQARADIRQTADNAAGETPRALLTRACTVCEELLSRNPRQWRVRSVLAECYRHLADLEARDADRDKNPALHTEALTSISKSVALLQTLVGDAPTHAPFQAQLVQSLQVRSRMRQAAGMTELAAQDQTRADSLAITPSRPADLGAEPLKSLAADLAYLRQTRIIDSLPNTQAVLGQLLPKLRTARTDPQHGSQFAAMLLDALSMEADVLITHSKDLQQADARLAEAMAVAEEKCIDYRSQLQFVPARLDLARRRSELLSQLRRFDAAQALLEETDRLATDHDQPRANQLFSSQPSSTTPESGRTAVAAISALNQPGLRSQVFEHRDGLRLSLEAMRKEYVRSGLIDNAVVAWESEQQLRRDALQSGSQHLWYPELEQGLSALHWIMEADGKTYIEVSGHTHGAVWGVGPYTDDSDLRAAAIHAGFLQPGETRYLGIRWRPAASSFKGSTANGVTSASSDYAAGAYEIINSGIRVIHYNSVVRAPGDKPINVLLEGRAGGYIRGTDVYSIDSDLDTIAVHCGLVKPKELALIQVEFLPGRDEYASSTRNGVTSAPWGHSPCSIRLTRVD